jgi:large subunit ribosomal protein L33
MMEDWASLDQFHLVLSQSRSRSSERLAGFLFLRYIGYSLRYTIMSQDKLIQLKNKSTGETYWTSKNRKTVEKKLELKKYSAKLRKHVVFKEAKK